MENLNYIIFKANSRGYVEYGGWLKSFHSFSFGEYYNPNRMGFGLLRVINYDEIKGENGFGAHHHRDMEIVTIIFNGELTHKDSMGNKKTIKSNEVQRMSAGTGVVHSEMNLGNDTVKLFQIWVQTKNDGIEPSYEQNFFSVEDRKNKFQLLISPNGEGSSVSINQETYFNIINLDKDKKIEYVKKIKNNGIYIILIKGKIEIDLIKKEIMEEKDEVGIENLDNINIIANKDSEILIIEVPMN